MRDLRACLSLILYSLNIQAHEIPDFLKKPDDTMEGLKIIVNENRELGRVLNAVEKRLGNDHIAIA